MVRFWFYHLCWLVICNTSKKSNFTPSIWFPKGPVLIEDAWWIDSPPFIKDVSLNVLFWVGSLKIFGQSAGDTGEPMLEHLPVSEGLRTRVNGVSSHLSLRMEAGEDRSRKSYVGLPWWLSGKESACQSRRHMFDPWAGKIPSGRKWQPTPVFLPGESRGWRSLVGSMGSQRVRHDWSNLARTYAISYG